MMKNIKENQVMVREDGKWKRKNIKSPAVKMVNKGKNILHTYYLESGKFQEALDKMMEEEDLSPDKKIEFLNKLGMPQSNEHKVAISKIKGVISNYKYASNQGEHCDIVL